MFGFIPWKTRAWFEGVVNALKSPDLKCKRWDAWDLDHTVLTVLEQGLPHVIDSNCYDDEKKRSLEIFLNDVRTLNEDYRTGCLTYEARETVRKRFLLAFNEHAFHLWI